MFLAVIRSLLLGCVLLLQISLQCQPKKQAKMTTNQVTVVLVNLVARERFFFLNISSNTNRAQIKKVLGTTYPAIQDGDRNLEHGLIWKSG